MNEKIKILLITNKTDITSDFIIKTLSIRKASFYRLNTEEIGTSLQVSFDFSKNVFLILDKILGIKINLLNIKAVYFRRPEVHTTDNSLSEGESNFIKSEKLYALEGIYQILSKAFWLNNVYNIRNAENKIYQLILAKKLGFQIPPSFITNNSLNAYNFYLQNNNNCIIKPIKSGLVEGTKEEGVIYTNKVDLNEENLSRIEVCPIYLQKLVLKKGDIRVTIVGNEIFPAFIDSQVKLESTVDWRKSSLPLKHSIIQLPEDVISKCLKLTKKLKLNFAAIDFILDTENNYIFLEINPNGQWAWIERHLDYTISENITRILIEKSLN